MDMSARYKDEEIHVGSLSFCVNLVVDGVVSD